MMVKIPKLKPHQLHHTVSARLKVPVFLTPQGSNVLKIGIGYDWKGLRPHAGKRSRSHKVGVIEGSLVWLSKHPRMRTGVYRGAVRIHEFFMKHAVIWGADTNKVGQEVLRHELQDFQEWERDGSVSGGEKQGGRPPTWKLKN